MRNGLWLIVTALVVAALGLTACGRRGPLERPAAVAVDAGGQATESERPDRPFVLDGLVR